VGGGKNIVNKILTYIILSGFLANNFPPSLIQPTPIVKKINPAAFQSLNSAQERHFAKQGFQRTLDRIYSLESTGPLDLQSAVAGMGFALSDQFIDILIKGYDSATHFKSLSPADLQSRPLNLLRYAEMVAASAYIESTFGKDKRHSNGDVGIYGIRQDYLSYKAEGAIGFDERTRMVRRYYDQNPQQYQQEALGLMDQFYGAAIKKAEHIKKLYGSGFLKYFNIHDDLELVLICFRVCWNAGPNTSDKLIARVIVAMKFPELRSGMLSAQTAKFYAVATGADVPISQTREFPHRIGDIDRILDLFNGPGQKGGPSFNYEFTDSRIKSIRGIAVMDSIQAVHLKNSGVLDLIFKNMNVQPAIPI